MTYPATNLNEAVGLIVPDSNAFHNVINGDVNENVTLPEGGEVPTLRKALESLKVVGESIGEWTSGVTEFTAYNQYATYLGIPWRVKPETTLPYTAQGSDPSSLPDSDFVQPYQENDYGELPDGRVIQHRRGTSAEIAAYVLADGEIIKNDDDETLHVGNGVDAGGLKSINEKTVGNYAAIQFSNVYAMMSGNPYITLSAGIRLSSGVTTWEVTTTATAIDLGGGFYAKPVGHVDAVDFIDKTGATDSHAGVSLADSAASEQRTKLVFSSGICRIESDIIFSSNVEICDGAVLTTPLGTSVLFSNGFNAGLHSCLDLSGKVKFVNVKSVYPQWFGALGNSKANGTLLATTGDTTITLANSRNNFEVGDVVLIQGAAAGGENLSATVIGVTSTTIDIDTTIVTTVTSAGIITNDQGTALQRTFNSVKWAANTLNGQPSQSSLVGCTNVHFTAGVYATLGKLNLYSAVSVSGDFANVIGGVRLVQANIFEPFLNVIADNYSYETNTSSNGGNGNNYFEKIGFTSAHINDTLVTAPAVEFQNAWNIHSDTLFKGVLFQDLSDAGIGAGFITTGSINAGSNALTLENGSTFRSNGTEIGGSRLLIKGAGVAGADLETWIVSGGGTNNVIVNDTASTTVSSANVYPNDEKLELKLEDCEFDVCRKNIDIRGAVDASVEVDNLQGFNAIRGSIRMESEKRLQLKLRNSYNEGCGLVLDPAWDSSIYFDCKSDDGYVSINDTDFTSQKSPTALGGKLYIKGAKDVTINDNKLSGLDASSIQKALYIINAEHITINGTEIYCDDLATAYLNSRMIALSCPNLKSMSIRGGFADNRSLSGTFANLMQSDFPLIGAHIDTKFSGLADSNFNLNIDGDNVRNTILNPQNVTRIGTAPPTLGTWQVLDTVINKTPTAGSYRGWECVVAGTPGTWKGFGLIEL